MKAWLLEAFAGVETMKLAEVPDPAPAAGEVVLDVLYAALNPADYYLAQAQYPARPPLPHVLGRDAVGRVAQVGAHVSGINVGDTAVVLRGEVGVSRHGTFAERVAVPVESLVAVPEGWTPEQASCATLVYMTAYQALTVWPNVTPGGGKTVLITGASGGVGVAGIQLAKAMGHRVVALSRSEEKAQTLRELGADHTIDPTDTGWTKRVKGELNLRVDLAIDNVGGALFNQVLEVMGNNGRISCVGALAGPVPQMNTAALFFRRLQVGGIAVGAYTNPEARHAWGEVVSLLAKTGARPIVDSVYGFGQLKEAFGRLKEGPMGKVVVRVNG